jgi:thiamine-phosphate pyrophosphorylase
MNPDVLRLYLVADPDHCAGDLADTVARAIDGGVTCVQLRAKTLTDREQLLMALRIREICGAASIPFLVNDRLDIALASGADGIHLGVDDFPAADVRSLTGPDFLIGFSPDSDDGIIRSKRDGVDYLGIGPVFGTSTKPDAGSALGIEEFRRRCQLSPVPVVGIGGITAANTPSVIEAGAAGVAVVSAILGHEDPARAASLMLDQVAAPRQ